jgi:uncharacterized membrane protein (UPF0127 family)
MKLVVEVARTDKEKNKGLSGRQEMPENHGMLFVYRVAEQQNFWMKDTYIPLDISFLDDEGVIQEMFAMKPEDTNTTYSTGSYRLALETKRGFLEKHGITIGSRIILPNDLKEELKMASNKKLAAELVKLAKEIASQQFDAFGFEDEDERSVLKRMDPRLNSAVTKLLQVTNGDFAQMLTVIVMALRKAGHSAEAGKVFNIFKSQTLKRIEQIAPAI